MQNARLQNFKLLPIVVLSIAAAAGCGGGQGAGTTSGTPGVPPDARYDAGPFTVEPDKEIVMCTYVRGTNDAEEDVTRFVTEQSAGGHHLIVYTVDHPVDLPPARCSQGGQPGWSQLLATQDLMQEHDFPAGVGFHVAAHQQYVMETHYINTTGNTLTVSSSFTEHYGAPGEVTTRASTYFFGTMNIDVAPNSAATQKVTCSPPAAMALHTMFGHEHNHGTGVTVDFLPGGTGAPVQLYQTKQWDSPPITTFAEGQALGASDAVQVTCDWQNNGATDLRYPHEMCFAIGYYWPSDASLFCTSGGGKDTCQCRYQGKLDTGPGGSEVDVTLTRADTISGVKGDVTSGAPIYCALFRAQDWSGALPKPGAQPYYFRDQVDVPLATSSSTATFEIQDVTPEDYVVTCLMDTIGGGFAPGSGDAVNLMAAPVTAVKGQKAQVAVTLDFAIP
jgi:hypothetical protein